jgi:hypothetical protein
MKRTEQVSIILRVIARQMLDNEDAECLAKNIQVGMDWQSVAQRAFDEGLAPLLYYHCKNMNFLDDIPDGTKKFLARIYAETSLINMHLMKELEKLEKELEEKELQVIVLKGAALLKTVYRDVALRPMEDIDLVVRQEHLSELKKVLETMGFVQNRLYPGSFGKGILSIDIHPDFLSSHRIRSRQDILDISAEDMWGNAIPLNESSALYRLSNRDHLIALSFHLLKHRYDRLIWFVDIAESMKEYRSVQNWNELVAYARHIHADRLLLYTLLLARRLIGFRVPDEVLTDLGKGDLASLEKYILRLRLKHVPLGTVTDLLWLFQVRGTGRKLRFIKENAFPRREVMNQIFPDSSHRFATLLKRTTLLSSQVLYDFLRLFRGVLRGGLPSL